MAHLLAKANKVSAIKDIFGRARVSHKTLIKQECRYFIALVAKAKVSILLEEKTLKESLRSLYDVTLELNLQTISKNPSISKTDAENVFWTIIEKFLRDYFTTSPLR